MAICIEGPRSGKRSRLQSVAPRTWVIGLYAGRSGPRPQQEIARWRRKVAATKRRRRSRRAVLSGFAVGWVGGGGFGEVFGAGRIGIELEDAGAEGAGFVELAGIAGDVGEIHADGAAAGRASE